jgi:hypothetical protein
VLVASQSPNVLNADGAAPSRHHPARPGPRLGLPWLRALPALARPVALTMPWVTLIAGCLAGTAYLAVMAQVADTSRSPLTQGTVRLAFLPAIAALAFVSRTPFRPVTHITPVPAWVTRAGHLVLAAAVLAATCWAQLRIMLHTFPSHTASQPPAVYPLIAELTGWCAVTMAAAACVDRSRYADLGGGAAAPASAVAIALAWYLPVTHKLLAEPPASAHGVAVAWYCVAAAALALTGVAMRDYWHRYTKSLVRLFSRRA